MFQTTLGRGLGRFSSVILSRQRRKVFQQLQADLLAFFRVELRGENIVAPDGRREVHAVIRARGDDAFIHGLRIKTVDEINVAAAGDAAIERAIRLHDVKLVPADLRNFQSGRFGKASDFAAKNFHAGRAGIEFLAAFKQRLVADADAEKGFAGADEIFRRAEQFLLAERVDAVVERTDAGQHHRVGIADFARRFHEAHVRTDLEQRFMDAA